jgi:hypothetical protein
MPSGAVHRPASLCRRFFQWIRWFASSPWRYFRPKPAVGTVRRAGKGAMTGERMFIEVIKKKAKKMIENNTQKVTLDTVRDMIDDGAEQTRLFFEN